MKREDMFYNASKPAPPQPQPGEFLFEFLHGHDRFLCELRDHGEYGIEAAFVQNGELLVSRTFRQADDPTRAPRALAIQWAEAERRALETGADV
jgi:hypothetical protein